MTGLMLLSQDQWICLGLIKNIHPTLSLDSRTEVNTKEKHLEQVTAVVLNPMVKNQ